MPDPTTTERFRALVDRHQRELAAFREPFQRPGMGFSMVSDADLHRKLALTAGQPQILGQGWTSGTSAGSNASYSVYIANPGTQSYFPMFVTMFFGLANFAPDIIEGFEGRDLAWPYRTTERFTLAAGANVTKTFNYVVPPGTGGNTYTGNAVVWAGNWHDIGTYCDRGLFDITVS
ncbi:MAG: hypothetical protein U0359_11780 [Byssovorax sp.]